MLYPHTVRSGKRSDTGDEFILDGKNRFRNLHKEQMVVSTKIKNIYPNC